MTTEASKKAVAKYHKKMRAITVWFSPKDLETYQWVKNKGASTYIKTLIKDKKYMEENYGRN